MRKLGTVDLEILHLAKKENGTFNEKNLENSNLKRLGVGRILDALASLKDRKMISLNDDGSFTMTQLANEILWSNDIPIWAKILRLLQIKSCSINEITDTLNINEEKISEDLEKLRKNQFVLMSPQRQEEKLVKVFEILPEGIEEIDKTETEGFDKINFEESKTSVEIMSLIDEVIREIQNSNLEIPKKDSMVEKLSKLKGKLEI
ncbi:MAG: transcriptional regulator [Nitrosopumilus sp.]|uniref:ArsR family transcriptional regulator n=1 Tax=Nitrosopumilus sp. TaxID=2024843 RepID=UPI00247B8ADC|nr:ArsR family transcriptional regulator [Nitrosopumilus sp.]MCV0392077.1 transcriptional regulator [Nitrosopumilus sp.]